MKTFSTDPGMSPPAEPQAPTRVPPSRVIIIGALSGLGIFSTSTYLPALPSMIEDVGTTTSAGQLTLTAALFGLALGQVITGPLSDALGRRRPLTVGLVVYVLASLLCAVAPSAPMLIAFRFLQGMAGATGLVTAMATVRDLYSGSEMARFLTFTGMVTGAAPVVAPLVGGQLLALTSWRGIFVFLAVLGAILAIASALTMRETLPEERRNRTRLGPVLRTYWRLLRERRYLGYALSYGLGMGALFAYVSASPFVLQTIHGLSAQTFSLVIGFNAIAGITSGQISGRLVARVSPQRLLAVGLVLGLFGGLIVIVSVLASLGLAGLLPGFFVVSSSVGFVVPNSMALALADHQHEAGSAAGLTGLLGQATGGLAAPIVGIAGPTTALPMAITMVVLSTSACGAFMLLALRRSARKSAPDILPAQSADLQAAPEISAASIADGMRAVTISREYGSGGGEVAARLASRLGWQLIDHAIVVRVAQALGVSQEAAEEHDERTDRDLPEALAEFQALQTLAVTSFPIEVARGTPAYDQARRLVIQQAAAAGRAVIIGRGAQVLLGGRRDVLHARIVAPLEQRITYVMSREGLDAAAARERIECRDRERARLLMAAHNRDATDDLLYDIVANTSMLDLDSVVDLLVLALERKRARLMTPDVELGPGAGLEHYPVPPVAKTRAESGATVH